MTTPTDLPTRIDVVRRRDAYERDPAGFCASYAKADRALQKRLTAARARLPGLDVPDATLEAAARLCLALGTDGLRGELTLMRTARALAAYEGAETVGIEHLRQVAPSALRHRLRRNPLERIRLHRPRREGGGGSAGLVSESSAIWADALRVARLVAADPHGCGGVVLRAGAGPVRDRWLDILRENLNPVKPLRRMPAGIAEDRLIGGLDLAATLGAGRPVAQAGLLAEADGGLLVAAMAERMGQGTAAHLAAALDTGRLRVERDGLAETRPAKVGLVLLDEGIGEDEAAPASLTDRLAFHIDLTTVPPSAMRGVLRPPCDGLSPESDKPPHGGAPSGHDPVAELSEVAARLGIDSLRAPLLALRVARLLARLDGRAETAEADAREAARLVLGHRATRLPEHESDPGEEPEEGEPSPPEQAPAEKREPGPDPEEGTGQASEDRIVEAARAAIPAGLLAMLMRDGPRLRMPKAGKAGAKAASARSGRPMGARPGDPRRARLDLIATLRAASPWQGPPPAGGEGAAPVW